MPHWVHPRARVHTRPAAQAYSIMSLYLEQFAVRAQLIGRSKEIPRDMVEAVSSTIYASRVGGCPLLLGALCVSFVLTACWCAFGE